MRQDIEDRAGHVMKQACSYVVRFESYVYLWEDDKEEYLKQFLKYGRQLTAEDFEPKIGGEEIQEEPASLEQFREAVKNYILP